MGEYDSLTEMHFTSNFFFLSFGEWATPTPRRTHKRGAMGSLLPGKCWAQSRLHKCLGEQPTACYLTQSRMTGHCSGKEMNAKDRFVDNTIISLSNWHIIGVSNSLLQINSSSSGHRIVSFGAKFPLQFKLNLLLKDTTFIYKSHLHRPRRGLTLS